MKKLPKKRKHIFATDDDELKAIKISEELTGEANFSEGARLAIRAYKLKGSKK